MTAVDKPRIRILAPNTWAIAYGKHNATVKSTPSTNRWDRIEHADTITIHGKDGLDSTIELGATEWRKREDVLAFVVGYFDAVDDAQVYCDSLLAQGEELSKKARKALVKQMTELHRDRGIVPFTGRFHEGSFVLCVADFFVRFYDAPVGYRNSDPRSHHEPLTYRVGDECVVDSYNLKYIGPITKITDRFVWCRKSYDEKQKRHTLESFYSYNDRPVADAYAHNAEERMYI